MRILITGATGLVGKNLVQALVSDHDVILLVRDTNKVATHIIDKVFIIKLNDDWKSIVKKANPEIVIHLASYLTSSDDELTINKIIDANLLFGTHLLNALSQTDIKYFINTGTFAEYLGNNPKETEPAYLYAATKTAYRSILQYYQAIIGFKTINVIPYTIYGGKDTQKKLIDIIYKSLDGKMPIQMSPGEQVLDFIHIDDVVNFYLSLINNIAVFQNNFSEIHLGSGIGVTPKVIAKIFEKLSTKTANINWGGLPYRKRDTLLSVAPENMFPFKFFEWKPTITLEDGVSKYLSLKNNCL